MEIQKISQFAEVKSCPFSYFWIGRRVSFFSHHKDVDPENWHNIGDIVKMLHDHEDAIEIIE
jgi:hypothetical protein